MNVAKVENKSPVQETEGPFQEIEELKKKLERAKKEEEKLKKEWKLQKDLHEAAKKQNKASKEEYEKIINEKNKKIKQQESEINRLSEKITQLEQNILKHLQRKGRVCSRDCVWCVMLWICKRKLGELNVAICNVQLVKIMTWITTFHRSFEIQQLECKWSMEIFEKHEIVKIIFQDGIGYEDGCGGGDDQGKGVSDVTDGGKGGGSDDNEQVNLDKIEKAWDTLVTRPNDEKVCILGTENPLADGGGHCLVFDLEESRSEIGKLVMYDPQQSELPRKMGKEDFRKNFIRDKSLTLYIVKLKNLEEILHYCRKQGIELHCTDTDCHHTGTFPSITFPFSL